MPETTIPAHDFEPAKRVTAGGLLSDERCGYLHRIDDESGVFCTYTADRMVHHGQGMTVAVTVAEMEEIR